MNCPLRADSVSRGRGGSCIFGVRPSPVTLMVINSTRLHDEALESVNAFEEVTVDGLISLFLH